MAGSATFAVNIQPRIASATKIARYRRQHGLEILGRERYALIIEGSPKCRDIGETGLHFRSSITIQIQEEGEFGV